MCNYIKPALAPGSKPTTCRINMGVDGTVIQPKIDMSFMLWLNHWFDIDQLFQDTTVLVLHFIKSLIYADWQILSIRQIENNP